MNLQLHELLNIQTCQIEFEGKLKILKQPVSRFSIDSRKIKSEEIFIALKGEKFDGHQFISDVLRKGVKALIVSKYWYESQDQQQWNGNFFIVDDTLVALQEISHYYRLKFNIPLLALTGSNGKTTTKEMIAAVLGEKYHVLKNEGNLNNHIGVPLSLFEITANHNIAVIEMGTNHFGEITRLAGIAHPTCGLITNIGPAHLEFFGSLEGVFKAKSELWRYLEQHGQIAFVNVDDDLICKNLPSIQKVITYGFQNSAQIQGKLIGIDEDGRPSFYVNDIEINLGIVGMHNIYNALAAVAVGLEFDLNMNQIKVALERFLPTAKRMEVIRTKGVIIINDCYNSNPESVRKSLLTLSQMQAKGRRIAVLADMLELGAWAEIEHQAVGEFVVSLINIDFLLTYGPLSRLTSNQAGHRGMTNAIYFEDKAELIDYLKKIISKDDILLIKGSRGMLMEEVTTGIIES